MTVDPETEAAIRRLYDLVADEVDALKKETAATIDAGGRPPQRGWYAAEIKRRLRDHFEAVPSTIRDAMLDPMIEHCLKAYTEAFMNTPEVQDILKHGKVISPEEAQRRLRELEAETRNSEEAQMQKALDALREIRDEIARVADAYTERRAAGVATDDEAAQTEKELRRLVDKWNEVVRSG